MKKKLLSLILASMMLCSVAPFPAAAENASMSLSPTFEEVQALFPDLQLTEDGRIADMAVPLSSIPVTIENVVDMYNNPVQVYTAVESSGDICNLSIYRDGTYATYGTRLLSSENAGADLQPSTSDYKVYNVYWTNHYTGCTYHMSYICRSTTLSNGYAQIYGECNYGLAPNGWATTGVAGASASIEGESVGVSRQTQTSTSAPAIAYGTSIAYYYEMPLIRMTLTVKFDRSYTPTVETTAGSWM